MGVAEAAAEVIKRCPQNLRCALARNIIVTGGSSKFPNFKERLCVLFVSCYEDCAFRKLELNSLLEQGYEPEFINIIDPVTHAWHNAKNAAKQGLLKSRFISHADWEEEGDAISKRFHDFADTNC